MGLQHESGFRWHAWFHDVDLGTIEIANINDALHIVSSGLHCREPKRGHPDTDFSKRLTVSRVSTIS